MTFATLLELSRKPSYKQNNGLYKKTLTSSLICCANFRTKNQTTQLYIIQFQSEDPLWVNPGFKGYFQFNCNHLINNFEFSGSVDLSWWMLLELWIGRKEMIYTVVSSTTLQCHDQTTKDLMWNLQTPPALSIDSCSSAHRVRRQILRIHLDYQLFPLFKICFLNISWFCQKRLLFASLSFYGGDRTVRCSTWQIR